MSSTWREQLLETRKSGLLEEYAKTLARHENACGLKARIAPKGIGIAPIKSLQMLQLDCAKVIPTGLATECGLFEDRSVMLARVVEGKPYDCERFSQREEPLLALIRVELQDDGMLKLRAPTMNAVGLYPDYLRPRSIGEELLTQVIPGEDLVRLRVAHSGPLALWIETFLTNHGSRYKNAQIVPLARPSDFHRPVDDPNRCGTQAETTLSDGGQVLVASSSTLTWMNSLMGKENPDFEPLLMNAFRPNITFEWLPPNMEDVVSVMKNGEHEIRFGGLCPRCPVTQVTQATGIRRNDKLPLSWLAKHRPGRPVDLSNAATFCVNAVLPASEDNPWFIRSGDTFTVMAEK